MIDRSTVSQSPGAHILCWLRSGNTYGKTTLSNKHIMQFAYNQRHSFIMMHTYTYIHMIQVHMCLYEKYI